MGRFIACILLVICGICSTTPAPRLAAAQNIGCTDTEGQVLQQDYFSSVSRRQMSYSIYLPPCYNAPERATWRYPTVYLLHGSDAVDTGYWLRLGLKQAADAGMVQGTLPPMILVMPFGGEIANWNQFGTVSWANVILRDLIPHAESGFRIDARREARAIGGISRGGFWAYHLGFLYPDYFSAVGGHSAFFSLEHLKSANPLFLAETAPKIETLRLWLDHGQYDYANGGIGILHRRLEERGIIHAYTIYPEGRHNAAYWSSHTSDYLFFYGLMWFDLNQSPTPTPEPTSTAQGRDIPVGVFQEKENEPRLFYVPATSYRGTLANLDMEQIQAALRGEYDSKLILDYNIRGDLLEHNIHFHPEIPIYIGRNNVLEKLEADRSLYTIMAWDALTPRWRILRIDERHPVDYLLDGDAAAYPLVFNGYANFDETKLTRITFSGVTALVRDTADALDKFGPRWAAAGLRGFTRRADFFHMSNEVSFYPTCPQFDGAGGRPPGAFCAKDAHFALFEELGADWIELSGNHNNDYGHEAYLRTLEMYQSAGMLTFGGGENLAAARQPIRLEHQGNRVAVLSCNWAGPQMALAAESTPGAAYCDEAWLQAEIPRLKADHEVLIVTVQYREFDTFSPGPQQRRDFRWLADLGADVVIGTQAHVPQTSEFYTTPDQREVFIHYGLGNVYFDQTYFQMRFFMPTVYIQGGKLRSVDQFVGIIDDFGRPRPMDSHNRTHFLGHMSAR